MAPFWRRSRTPVDPGDGSLGDEKERPDPLAGRTEEERARILLAAKEAKTTIMVVAAIAIGSMIFMFLITLVIVALNVL